jgi:mannobiose 2-epimerase
MKTLHSFVLLTFLIQSAPRCPGADFAPAARQWKHDLSQKILPYWFDTAQDRQHGGYLLADDGRGRRAATEKQLVTQTRMIWGFAHAHLKGYSVPERDYLGAARQGYDFLLARFLDSSQGGYVWKTDLSGQPLNDRKILYGQAFVIYALVEYHRASGDPAPLRHALDLYRTLQRHAHDPAHGGWFEHFRRDWTPILKPEAGTDVEVAGYKSANAHLHWMEALAELFEVTRDRDVKKSLREAWRLNMRYFYPKDAGQSCFHRQPDWKAVTDPKSAGLSYGHNVEFAWLMVRAEQVLGRRPSWAHFNAHLQHALRYGADPEHGGLYNRGFGDAPATDRDKVWWVQSEWMAALTDALRHKAHPPYAEALQKVLEFITRHQADPADGIWFDTVTAEGRPKNPAKAHSWKANYHDVRAIVKFVDTFTPKN